MELKNKIRFVHHNPEYGTKFTIAYHRDEDRVVFAWTELYHTDEYVKSLGRIVSTARLMKFVESEKEISDVSVINSESKLGVLTSDYFKRLISNVIADNVLSKFTLMDFKHAAVSNALRNLVIDEIHNKQY